MKVATYGSKVFTVSSKKIYTFNSLTRTAGYNVEEQENGTNKPRLKKKAPELESMSFDIELKSDSVNVRAEIKSWIAMVGESHYFILGKDKYGSNKWKLTDVNVADHEVVFGGGLKKATLSLSFKEDPGTSKSSSAKSTRNAKG
jgi:hypothetical protein